GNDPGCFCWRRGPTCVGRFPRRRADWSEVEVETRSLRTMIIDSHAHLDVPNYETDRAEVITRAREAGIEIVMEICGSDIAGGSLDAGLKLVEEHPFMYGAVGVHPHEASLYDQSLEQKLCAMSRHEKIIGWGEIGLDYYYDNSPRDVQRRVFLRQLELGL